MAALINTPSHQSNEPLPPFIDATDANSAGEDSFEALRIAKFGQVSELVLNRGQGGGRPVAPLRGAMLAPVDNLDRLAARDEDLRQALIPEGVLEGQWHQRARAQPGYQRS